MRILNIILVAVLGLLFCLNSKICNAYYDSSLQSGEWWNLRFKFYSLMFSLSAATVFINVERKVRIVLLPVIALMLGDLKDRVVFDSPVWHWSDWILIIVSVSAMLYLLYNEYNPRK